MPRISRLNRRAAVMMAVVATLCLALGLGLWFTQTGRVRRAALDSVQRLLEEGDASRDEAIKQLDQLLKNWPKDREALQLIAKASAQKVLVDKKLESLGQLFQTIDYNEQVLRHLGTDSRADLADIQEVRTRLVNLYLIQAEMIPLTRVYSGAPELREDDPSPLALKLARQVVDDELSLAERESRTVKPSVCRLQAMALEGVLKSAASTQEVEEVITAYRTALLGGNQKSYNLSPEKSKFCPGDLGDDLASSRLMGLYVTHDRRTDAVELFDRIARDNPNSASIHLLGYNTYRHFASEGRRTVPPAPEDRIKRDEQRAKEELDAAVKIAEEGAEPLVARNVVLTAAEAALQRGNGQLARTYLDRIPEESRRGDPMIAFLEGLIALAEERPQGTMEIWRRGLIDTGGTSPPLTWWLAYFQLQANQLTEAERLIEQYRRLSGAKNKDPLCVVLEAGLDIRAGHPDRAIEKLDPLRTIKLTTRDEVYALPVKVELLMGQALEALNKFDEAQAAYDRAVQLAPNSLEARLSLAKLRSRRDPARALQDLDAALAKHPDNGNLLAIKAHALQQKLATLPKAERDFKELDQVLDRARRLIPDAQEVVLLDANRLLLDEKPEAAVELLSEKVRPFLREAPDKGEPVDARTKSGELLLIALVQALSRSGREPQALQALELASRPWNLGDRVDLRLARATLLLSRGRGRDALSLLETNRDAFSRSDQERLAQAVARFRLSQSDIVGANAAIAAWSRLAPRDEQPRLLQLELAMLCGDQKQGMDILRALKARRAADPNEDTRTVDNVLDLAEAAYRIRELESARSSRMTEEREKALKDIDNLLSNVRMNHGDKVPTFSLLRGRFEELRGNAGLAIQAYQLAWNNGQGTPSAFPRLVGLLARDPAANGEALARLRAQMAGGVLDPLAVPMTRAATDPTAIVQLAGEAVRSSAMTTSRRLEWANRFIQLHQLEQAEATLKSITDERPAQEDGWLDLVRVRALRGADTTATIAQAKKAVKTAHPDLFEARCLWCAQDRAGADRAYRRILERDPNNLDALSDASILAKERGDLGRSIELLRKICHVAPDRKVAFLDLATALSETAIEANWEEAAKVLGPERPDETLDERIARALVLARAPGTDRKVRAVQYLEALLADFPGDDPRTSLLRKQLAREYLATRQPDRAYDTILPLVVSVDDTTALGLCAEALVALRRFEEAESRVLRLEQVEPGSALAVRSRLALIVARSGGTKPIAAMVAAVESQVPLESTALGENVQALARAVFDLAISENPPALDEAEKVARLLMIKVPGTGWMGAAVQARRGQTEKALDLCLEAAKQAEGKDRVDAARVASEIALAPGASADQFAKAEAVLALAKGKGPATADLFVVESMMRHHQGKFEDEAKLCRQALALAPDNAIAANNLAWVLAEALNQPAEGLVLIDDLITKLGRKPGLVDTRGIVLLRLGRTDAAIADLVEAARGAPSASAFFHLARAYAQAGKDAELKDARERAKKANIRPEDLDITERDQLGKVMGMSAN